MVTRVADAVGDQGADVEASTLDAMLRAGTGNALKLLRVARCVTQEQLAERVGVDVNSISRWERGMNTPGMRRQLALAEALGCDVADLEFAVRRRTPVGMPPRSKPDLPPEAEPDLPPEREQPPGPASPIAEVWLRKDGSTFRVMFVHEDESTSRHQVRFRSGPAAQREITGYLVQRGYRPSSAWVQVAADECTRKFRIEGGEPR